MVEIYLETSFPATPERVFDLIRDVSIHPQTTGKTKERVVESSRRLLELGDTVTFEAIHFGIRQRLTSEVVEYERPTVFTDRMTKGAFKSLFHERRLTPQPDGTLMKEKLRFEAPLGPLGKLAERLFLARYMQGFLRKRNESLKAILRSSA